MPEKNQKLNNVLDCILSYEYFSLLEIAQLSCTSGQIQVDLSAMSW